ncbi:MAG: hypothetical protein EHM36_06915 [Deltaproteobacteria bacterium]|nr:MAG: hypothetical protein EHM36_06915 [Deltaproteobacteria bacterium]
MVKQHRFFVVFIFLFLTACAPLWVSRIPASFERPQRCQQFFDRLDEAVEDAGVRDASSFSVPGFPYLRTDRFLAAFVKDIRDEEKKKQWVHLMQELDLNSREKEVRNLPDEKVLSLMAKEGGALDRDRLIRQTRSCSSELLVNDQRRPEFYETLYPLVHVPDEYSFLMRTAGFYPLVSLPVAVVTKNAQRKIRSWYEASLDTLPVDGQLTHFGPLNRSVLSEDEIQRMIEESRGNPAGIPLLDPGKQEKLVLAFAPVFIQDVSAPYDRIGRMAWRGNRPEVVPEEPAVYYYISYALLKGEPILQINYVLWYPERAGERSPRIERGQIDGLTVRISLDGQGKPFVVDIINNCGCYHLFAPDKERIDGLVSRAFQLDPFVPQSLPAISSGQSLGVRINSGWHQVQRIIAVEDAPSSLSYQLLPYDSLEVLPHEDGRTESVFDGKGIVKDTRRVERFVLFSMGIPSVGSMRQRGHHAIELIGRVHFDDPYLFEKSFVWR